MLQISSLNDAMSSLGGRLPVFSVKQFYNTKTVTWTLSSQHSVGDVAVLFNGNQKVAYLICLDATNTFAEVIHGTHTATVTRSVSGTSVTYTLTDSGTLWGASLLFISCS